MRSSLSVVHGWWGIQGPGRGGKHQASGAQNPNRRADNLDSFTKQA